MNLLQLNKEIQKERKNYKSIDEKIFIRHWNVVLNHARNRPIERIEQKSHKFLCNQLLKDIAKKINIEEFEYKLDYSVDDIYWFISRDSKLFKLLEE